MQHKVITREEMEKMVDDVFKKSTLSRNLVLPYCHENVYKEFCRILHEEITKDFKDDTRGTTKDL